MTRMVSETNKGRDGDKKKWKKMTRHFGKKKRHMQE